MTVATTNKTRGIQAENQSPAVLMREHGFNPNKHMTPVQFLLAVMNNEVEKIYPGTKGRKKRDEIEKRGGIGLAFRIECARVAAKFIHRELQAEQPEGANEAGFAAEMQKALADGHARIQMREVIIQRAFDAVPGAELAEASYPEVFRPQEAPNYDAGPMAMEPESLPDAAGEVGYDPDTE